MFKGLYLIVFSIFAVSAGEAAPLCIDFYNGRAGKSFESLAAKAHQEITETLYLGYPVKVRSFSANGNRNPLFLVTLENPKNKKQVTALFKPRNYGDGDGWNRVPMEYVSYEVSRMLDLDVIPPVAYRRGITLDGTFFHEGSMQYFVDGAKLLKEIGPQSWNVDKDYFISNTRVLDVLLENPDRHFGNFIFGPHWVDGLNRPGLIDQAANLRKGTVLDLTTVGPFNDQPIITFDPHTVKKLRELSEEKLKVFLPFISIEEINRILRNRDRLILSIDSHSLGKL